MTLVQANNAATIVSVGVWPMFVLSRFLGSPMTVLVRQFPCANGSGSYHEYVAYRWSSLSHNHDLLPPVYRSSAERWTYGPYLRCLNCLIGCQRTASRLTPTIESPGVPFSH